MNAVLVQIVRLDGSSSMPEGWLEHGAPAAAPWTDTSVYELHIRDFRYLQPQQPAFSACAEASEWAWMGLRQDFNICTILGVVTQ